MRTLVIRFISTFIYCDQYCTATIYSATCSARGTHIVYVFPNKQSINQSIIRKLANSKWGCMASTLRPSCLALCYSAAEYACPVWARSTHAHMLNPALHDCCRIISGYLKPTNLDSVHLQAGIAPPHIRYVACRMEQTRQTTDARHQLFHHQPAVIRLKSRKSFMRTVTPLDSSASSSRLRLWKDSLTDVPASVKMGLDVAESLPAGSGEDGLCWRALNRLRTGVGRAKTVMRRWGYLDDAQSVDCDCGERILVSARKVHPARLFK